MTRSTNARTALKVAEPTGATTLKQARIADMAALAQLPEPVRFLLNELAIKLSSASVLAYYQSIARQARALGGSSYDAEVHTCRKLVAIEASDQDGFAEAYLAKHGHQLPHKAAEVSILRYGPLEQRRRVQLLARRGLGRIPLPPEIREAA